MRKLLCFLMFVPFVILWLTAIDKAHAEEKTDFDKLQDYVKILSYGQQCIDDGITKKDYQINKKKVVSWAVSSFSVKASECMELLKSGQHVVVQT